MHISSVRDLKSELKEARLIPRAVAAAVRATATPALAARAARAHVGRAKATLLAVGVAAGGRRGDFRLAARIQTRGAAARRIAAEIENKTRGECDIRIVPRIMKRQPRPSWFRRRQRPLESGLSVAHFDVTAGTIGCIVEDDDAYYVLSNNHVLANVNQGSPGDPVLQPGPADAKPRAGNMIGVLDRYVPISFQRSNVVDAAVAELFEDVEFWVGWTEAIPGVVTGTRPLTEDDVGRPVRKAGRTTGVTEGRVTAVELDRARVDMGDDPDEPEEAVFSNQFEVSGTGRAFSDGGDSGSLIVLGRRAVGLLFAGGFDVDGNDLTYANQIDLALGKLGVALAL